MFGPVYSSSRIRNHFSLNEYTLDNAQGVNSKVEVSMIASVAVILSYIF